MGDILSSFFGVMFGLFCLGMATPNIRFVNEGIAAGTKVF